MGDPRYTVEEETTGKWLTEEVVESAGHDADEATRVTITDEKTGKSVSGAGSDYDEALEVACEKMGISEDDLEAEIGDDDDDDEDIDDDDVEAGGDEE
jgi:ribosome-binding protein aMBF1 (putative translation factor)